MLHSVIVHHEKSVAGDGHIGGGSRRLERALTEIAFHGRHRSAHPDLLRISIRGAADLIVKQILKIRVAGLESDGIHVGQVIGDDGKLLRTGVQTRKRY